MKHVIMSIVVAFLVIGCTDTQRAKQFGGKMIIDLPAGKKFVNATWKDANLWYVTRDRNSNESIETFELTEASNFGIMQGVVIFKEH